jgi:hypothetical protein
MYITMIEDNIPEVSAIHDKDNHPPNKDGDPDDSASQATPIPPSSHINIVSF